MHPTNYHYTEETESKNVVDVAYEVAVEAGKFEAETLHDLLINLPTRKDLLEWMQPKLKKEVIWEGSGIISYDFQSAL